MPTFVDAGQDLRYNILMEGMVYDVIATQVAVPEKKHIRSEGILYTLLVLGALAVIGLGNRLQAWLDLPPVLVQGTLYAGLFLLGYWVLRFRLTIHIINKSFIDLVQTHYVRKTVSDIRIKLTCIIIYGNI